MLIIYIQQTVSILSMSWPHHDSCHFYESQQMLASQPESFGFWTSSVNNKGLVFQDKTFYDNLPHIEESVSMWTLVCYADKFWKVSSQFSSAVYTLQ